jgi:hypothetical protein
MSEINNRTSIRRRKRLTEYPGTEMATILLEGIGIISSVLLAWFLGKEYHDRYLNLLATLVGASLGWALAVLASPYSETDSTKFTQLTRTISLLGSGYLISKLDKVIEAAFKPEVILEGTVFIRVLLFTTGLLIIGMGTLSSRLYINERRRNAVDTRMEALQEGRLEGTAQTSDVIEIKEETIFTEDKK